MRVLFCGKVAKVFEDEEYNEDAYAISQDSSIVAISDGATDSFDSRAFANIIVNQFIFDSNINQECISLIVNKYNSQQNYENLSWSKQAAFERGSFASLLGVTIDQENSTVEIIAVGDTLAILLDGDKIINSFPYKSSQEFDQRPELLSTIPQHNQFVNSEYFNSLHKTNWNFSKSSNPLLLCMTDALGQWVLREEEKAMPVYEKLCSIRTIEQLQELVTQARVSREMRIDDVTFVLIELSKKDEFGISIS